MKKCKGCGVELQTENKEAAGYVSNIEQDYCMRCFRLIHYGDINRLKDESIDNNEILKIYDSYSKACFILIVDCFDALIMDIDNLLSVYKDHPLILIINKIDLLPRNMKDNKMEDMFSSLVSKVHNKNILSCLLSYKGDISFSELFFKTINDLEYKEFVFVGRANAGKSTIINKLLKNDDLTVSTYPGTTINTNVIEVGKYTFIDTPGLKDEESLVTYIDKSSIKSLLPNKCVKPKLYQFYEPVSYLIQGLVKIDCKPKKNASIAFYINNELDVHRTKLEGSSDYLKRHEKEYELKYLPFKDRGFKVNHRMMFYIKGLGFIKVNGNAEIHIQIHSNIHVYTCEVNI